MRRRRSNSIGATVARAARIALAALASGALAGAVRGQQTAVFVMAVDGSGVRKVAQVEGFRKNGYPRWSHDGRRLAFDAYDGPNREKKVFVVNRDGTALTEMGPHGAVPDWSPDDKQLAYESYGEGGVQTGSWVQNVDGKGRDWITGGFSPRFSPDGGRLAFTDWHTLMIRDLIDDSERNLLDRSWVGILAGFDWSPDGRRIALIGKRTNNNRALYVVGTAPGDTEALVLAGRN